MNESLPENATFEQMHAAQNAKMTELTLGLVSEDKTQFFCSMKE